MSDNKRESMDKKVSIIMPLYKDKNFVANSIQSVLDQTYKNWELLVIDDKGEDGSVSIVESFCDERIKLFHNDKNSGAAVSRNIGLKNATGKWIAFLDADDLWVPTKLEEQILFMEENGYNFSYTKYQWINEEGSLLNKEISGPKRITRRMMFNSCYVGCLTVMYNREIVGDIQIRDIKKRNDYALWLKAIKKADCYLLDKNLAFYRKCKNSISSGSKIKLIKYHYELFNKNEGLNPIVALWYTCMNLIYGVFRKLKYTKEI